MALTVPSNVWPRAKAKLAEGIAALAAGQALLKVSTQADAAARVFLDQLKQSIDGHTYTPEELEVLRAYLLVAHAPKGALTLRRRLPDAFDATGRLVIGMARLITGPEEATQDTQSDSDAEIERVFENDLGDLLIDLPDWMDENLGPYVRAMAVTDGPWQTHPEDWATVGRWHGAELEILWGLPE